jgi:glycerol-3-phosphate acyltransferase PlsX
VALLSNGEERSKGNELTRASALLIEKHPAFQTSAGALDGTQAGTFLGYCEGKEIFQGQVDVVVTDGFTGNVMLKSVEGLGKAIITLLKREAKAHPFSMIGFFLAGRVLKNLKKKLDYAEYGAAPLLGVAGYAFVCHGRSKAKAIKNALLATQNSLKSGFVERLAKTLPQEPSPPAPEKDQNRSEPK